VTIGRRPKDTDETMGLRNHPEGIVAAIHKQRLTKRWAIIRTIQIHSWLFKPSPILEQVRLVNERIPQKHLEHRNWDCRILSLTKCRLVEEDARGVAVAEAGTGRQLEDPLLQEAEAQMKDNPAGEEELCGLEVQARRLGEHVEDRQTQMLVPAKGSQGWWFGEIRSTSKGLDLIQKFSSTR
jgi:hypothetical protein